MYFFGFFFMALQFSGQAVFTALGMAKKAIFFSIFRKVIIVIPLIYILPAIIEDKETAVYLAEPVADVIAVLTTATMFAVGFGKSMKSLKKNDAKQ